MLHCSEELPAQPVHPGVVGGKEALQKAKMTSTRGNHQHGERVVLTLSKWESCLGSDENIYLLRMFLCNTAEYCMSIGMYFTSLKDE